MNEQDGSGETPDPGPKISYEGVLENMGLAEREDKPFWAKFLRNDYLEQQDSGPVLPGVLDVLEGNKKVDEIIAPDEAESRALALYTGDDDPDSIP